jgi:CheY-like chemotaxis protein/K+-sensing histidine kinase KdpD
VARALIVDDNDQNRYLLEALLRGHGHQVTGATNGAEALAAARRERPDLVISDILMPVMDGFSLCRAWKQDAQLKSVPFVFYTATYTDPKDEQLALSLGADRFIIKPVEPEVFIEAVEEVLAEQGEHALSSRAPEPTSEAGYLRRYSEALVRKLEDKVHQLEEANRALSTEISERKRLEGLRDQFLATAAHELKTPITTIKGYSQLLQRWAPIDARPQKERIAIGAIDAQCDRMQRRVDQMLAAARYQTGPAPARPERIDLGELAWDVVRRLQATTDTHRVSFEQSTPLFVDAEADQVDEAVTTLLDRMLRAMPSGENVRVRLWPEDGEVRLSITGHGPVVSKDQEASYFEPLYEVRPPADARHLPIVELGPYLARLAIERQKGRVWFERSKGDDSAFVVALPRAEG